MAGKLGLEEARVIVDTMLAEGKRRGLNFAGAVTDAGGDLIHLSRMDDASALNARMSFHKAYTAVKWKRNTRVIQDNLFAMSLGDDRREISWFCDPMYTPVWGGILLNSARAAVPRNRMRKSARSRQRSSRRCESRQVRLSSPAAP